MLPGTSPSLPTPHNPTYAYIGAFVDELARAGLRHIVICPGSRSTPLALSFAASPTIRTWMHVDERSAAFFALGMARRLAQPVALLCTSGTAAANFLPAIVEAHLTHTPLLVLTADRPPELRECGAPQAIDQQRLYGTHAKWLGETALPEATNEALRYIRTIADRSLALTQIVPAGPVHINMPLREPLTPAALPSMPLPPDDARDPLAWQGRPANQPYIQVETPFTPAVSTPQLAQLARQIAQTPRGLIVVGPQTSQALVDPLLRLAASSGYPLLADPLAQLRGATATDLAPIVSYDAFLRNEPFCAYYQPDLILRFGTMPTSKALLLYLQRYPACPQVVIDGQGGWEEPTQLAAQMIYADPATFCRSLALSLEDAPSAAHLAWHSAWSRADQVTRQALTAVLHDRAEIFEGRVFSELSASLPPETLLYAGNSMPIRDMDTFFWPPHPLALSLGNRGASGIDGVISSALGASAAGEPQQPAVLVIGDLSFFHDLNGLLAARLHRLHLTIVLVNNNGGGIFSFLPQAAYPEHFEQLFGTPTDLDFRPVVEMYGGTFERISTWEGFRQALQHALTSGSLHVIEVPTSRERNVVLHRSLWPVVDRALAQAHLLPGNEA